MSLAALVDTLHRTSGAMQKQDIQGIARQLGMGDRDIAVGDDCAAIPDGEGYLLLAAEGMWPTLVASDPWFAGWCAVMVNVSDIYAMGGRPLAVVDALWSRSAAASQPLWEGMQAAARAYNVPIVGGHTNCHSPYDALAVAILGRAQSLLTSFDARPGDRLLMVADFAGKPHPDYPFWNAATAADPIVLRRNLNALPELAECGLCKAGKDISMGGAIGTVVMLMETSGCGATLNVDCIPRPAGVDLDWWLRCFPSYGFILSARADCVVEIQACFEKLDLVCAPVGTVNDTQQVYLHNDAGETALFWDFARDSLTGFAGGLRHARAC